MIAIPTNIHSGVRPRNVLKYQFCNVKILLLNTLQLSFVRRSDNSERIMLQSDIVIILDLSWTKFFQPSAFALEKYDTLDDDVVEDRHKFFCRNEIIEGGRVSTLSTQCSVFFLYQTIKN